MKFPYKRRVTSKNCADNASSRLPTPTTIPIIKRLLGPLQVQPKSWNGSTNVLLPCTAASNSKILTRALSKEPITILTTTASQRYSSTIAGKVLVMYTASVVTSTMASPIPLLRMSHRLPGRAPLLPTKPNCTNSENSWRPRNFSATPAWRPPFLRSKSRARRKSSSHLSHPSSLRLSAPIAKTWTMLVTVIRCQEQHAMLPRPLKLVPRSTWSWSAKRQPTSMATLPIGPMLA
mmetsp:Transcript_17485/g.43625  ORF Transcript_17485/g.43625 Transcript_17485/m.43625 type:complete len:234 (-) Transcript_17485:1176-1877(-)